MRVIVICAWMSMISGCGEDEGGEVDPGTGDRFVEADSAGVAIVTSPGVAAATPLPWAIGSEPTVALGTREEPAHQFFDVRGARQLSDGRIAVLDGSSQELRVFAPDGSLDHIAGRKGKGPGEFEYPVLVPWLGSDSLLIFDQTLARFHLYDPVRGEFESIGSTPWPMRQAPAGRLGPVVFTQRVLVTRAEHTGLHYYTVIRKWIHLETTHTVTLDTLFHPDAYISEVSLSHPPIAWDYPFWNDHPPITVGRDGVLVLGSNGREIQEYDPYGALRRVFRIDRPGRPVTQPMIDRMVERKADLSPVPGAQALFTERYRSAPIPDTLPEFSKLIVDAEGWLWARRFEAEEEERATWVVFDLTGRVQGSIRTPTGLDVLDIGPTWILGIARDKYEVESVLHYSLSRNIQSRLERESRSGAPATQGGTTG